MLGSFVIFSVHKLHSRLVCNFVHVKITKSKFMLLSCDRKYLLRDRTTWCYVLFSQYFVCAFATHFSTTDIITYLKQ